MFISRSLNVTDLSYPIDLHHKCSVAIDSPYINTYGINFYKQVINSLVVRNMTSSQTHIEMAHTHTHTNHNKRTKPKHEKEQKSFFIWFPSCKIKVIHRCTKVNTEQTRLFLFLKKKKNIFLIFQTWNLTKEKEDLKRPT